MKYFYTDPLAAAWMAKHFGMLFTGYNSLTSIFPVFALGDDKASGFAWNKTEPKFYIHPDSLQILEPQVNDLIWSPDDNGIFGMLVENSQRPEDAENPFLILTSTDGYYKLEKVSKIIQRNGIVFMWPESEA